MGDDGSWDHAVLYLTLMALVRKLKPTLPPLLLLPKPSANALPGHLVMSLAGQAPSPQNTRISGPQKGRGC